MGKNEISPRMRKLLEKGRVEARNRVIERGVVQFRADPDMMKELLEISEARRVPLGTMLREWVGDRLRHEKDPNVHQGASRYADFVNQLSERLDYLESHFLARSSRGLSRVKGGPTPNAEFYLRLESKYVSNAKDRYFSELERAS